MSDMAQERREDCKARHTQVDKLWNWFMGNGNHGAGERLLELENTVIGKEDSAAMVKIKDHIGWHEREKKFRWGTMVPLYLLLLGMLLQIAGVIK